MTGTPRVEFYPAVSALRGGGFIVAWESTARDGSALGVYGRRYAADGRPVGAQFRVNTSALRGPDRPAVTVLRNGGFTVLWSSVTPGTAARDVFGQSYNPTGHRFDLEFPVNTTRRSSQWQPEVAPLGKNGFVATWTSRDQDGSLEGVYGQRFNIVP